MKGTALIVLTLAGCCSPSTAETVAIRGTVTFAGVLPKKRPIVAVDIPEIPPESLQREDLVVDERGGVRWAFVYISRGVQGRAYDGPPLRMEQSALRYQPHVVGLRVGQTLEIYNRDRQRHNVNRVSFLSRSFGAAMVPDAREPWTTRFEKPEVMVGLRCNIHPWMSAWVGVLDHPHFAVTDAEGNFEIKNLAPGHYTLAVWHEKLRPEEREITVTDNATENFSLKGR